jgi:hypothetical protein
MKYILPLFIVLLLPMASRAAFITEIGFDYKRYYNSFPEACSDGYWFNGGGVSIGKGIGKDKLYIFSGLNYLPAAICTADQKCDYLQLPVELRCYFFNKIIFAEAEIDFRWLMNKESLDYSTWVSDFEGGYGLAFGIQQDIRKNLFLNLKLFANPGYTPEQRRAAMVNVGFEAELEFSLK